MNAQTLPLTPAESGELPALNARIDAARLKRAKRAFTTRRVPLGGVRYLLRDQPPKPGDLVLAKLTRVGQHKALQAVTGRRINLFVGDEIVAVYGNRYAPDQFEATVPQDLAPCQLVAGGGVLAAAVSSHARMSRATDVEPLGLLAESSRRPLNLADFALPTMSAPRKRRARVIAVVGTSMNSGKTTSAASLIRGLSQGGLRVGAAKVTGTGASNDPLLYEDAGAERVLDFVDFGHVSTYLASDAEIDTVLTQTVRHFDADGVDAIVVEIADGLLQPETRALLGRESCTSQIDAFVFAAADSMGAVAGVEWLERSGLQVLAVSGLVTTAPLAMRETRRALSLPVLGSEALAQPLRAMTLFKSLRTA